MHPLPDHKLLIKYRFIVYVVFVNFQPGANFCFVIHQFSPQSIRVACAISTFIEIQFNDNNLSSQKWTVLEEKYVSPQQLTVTIQEIIVSPENH